MTSPPRRDLAPGPIQTSSRSDEILTIAARLFQEAGYATTTIHHIADAVGVLPGSLYHHFPSKEDIAVGLLTNCGQALDDLGAKASLQGSELSPERRVRDLTTDLTRLSFRHAAAVKLRAYESPPSIASERFAEAMKVRSATLDRAWREAVGSLTALSPYDAVDLGLLRFTLQRLAFSASVYFPSGLAPRDVASTLCDVLLRGIATSPPSDLELDSSMAYAVATEVTNDWRANATPKPSDVTEKIVTAARTEFARRGYAATTIRDISNAAGVGMATLYRRVDSKEALLRQIIDAYADRLDRAFVAVLGAGSDEPTTIGGLARVFVHASRQFREESAIVNYGWTGREETSSPFHDYYIATQGRLHALENLLASGTRRGTLKPVASEPALGYALRAVMWTPYQRHARTSQARSFAFVRHSLLRGALSSD